MDKFWKFAQQAFWWLVALAVIAGAIILYVWLGDEQKAKEQTLAPASSASAEGKVIISGNGNIVNFNNAPQGCCEPKYVAPAIAAEKKPKQDCKKDKKPAAENKQPKPVAAVPPKVEPVASVAPPAPHPLLEDVNTTYTPPPPVVVTPPPQVVALPRQVFYPQEEEDEDSEGPIIYDYVRPAVTIYPQVYSGTQWSYNESLAPTPYNQRIVGGDQHHWDHRPPVTCQHCTPTPQYQPGPSVITNPVHSQGNPGVVTNQGPRVRTN